MKPTINPPTHNGAELEKQVQALSAQVDQMQALLRRNGAASFNPDDQFFLAWVLGFTAGAHLDRNGEQGERIFGRCRDMFVRVQEAHAGGNAS